MTLSPATFYDDNGVIRLQGQLDSQLVTVLGPYHVTFATADLANPADQGAIVGPVITAGTLVLAAWLATTTQWVADASVDDITVNLTDGALFDWTNASPQPIVPVVNAPAAASYPFFVRSGTQRLSAAVYSTGPLTAGAGDVYALLVAIV